MNRKKKSRMRDPFHHAKMGHLETLYAMENANEAYKWLNVAYDFGHRKAAGYIATVIEASDLRYDDDGFVKSDIHFELGISYLKNSLKHPRRLTLAKKHLQTAFEGTEKSDVSDLIDPQIISTLEPKEANILQKSLEWAVDPFRKASRHLNRLKRLHEIGSVPSIIIEAELAVLKNEIGKIADKVLE